jgi:hypothetical protein
MNGKTAAAISASFQSRANITTSSPMTVARSRTRFTSTVEARRATRLTSVMVRATSSPECTALKKLSDMPWMWAYRSRRIRAITRSPTAAMRYDCP